MAKTITAPGIRKPGNAEHIVKIQFDDNEPPKNYVWVHPDGFIKIWKNGKWVNAFESCDHHHDIDTTNYVTSETLNQKIKETKTEILAFIVKSLSNVSGSDDALTTYVKTQLEPKIEQLLQDSVEQESTNSNIDDRLSQLEGIDHSKFLTEHQSLSNYYDKSDVQQLYVSKNDLESSVSAAGFIKGDADSISDIWEDLSSLQSDFGDLSSEISSITDDLESAKENIAANSSKVSKLINKTDDLKGDITSISSEISNIKQQNQDSSRVVSEALNDLNTRLQPLEGVDFGIYITAEDI